MGRKIHKEEDETSKNKSKGYSANAGIKMGTVNTGLSLSSSKESSLQYMKESCEGIMKK
jgi:hypothetical protein